MCLGAQSSFSSYALSLYSFSDLEAIFSTIISPHLSTISEAAGVQEVGEKLVQVAVQVHCQLSSLFLPSPRRQHYLFNLRHIAGIFRYTIISLYAHPIIITTL